MVAQVVIKLALTAASMALQATKRIEGPRVTDLKVTSGDYGAPWPRVWGTRWLRPPVIWAEDLKEVKQTRKTKGGKFNDYTYFGFWAHGLAIHELAAVRRVKADGHLVYDASGAGPVTPFTLSGGSGKSGGSGSTIADYMRFVPGNFTQGPDPAILADVEAKNGEGSCPAYRGRSLLVFDGVPLEKFGNRIPQIEVEVVGIASPHYPFETFATTENGLATLTGATFSPDYSRFMWVNGTRFEIWDVAARARMIGATLPVTLSGGAPLGLYNSGEFLAVDSSNTVVFRFSADGASHTTLYTASSGGAQPSGVRVVADSTGTEHWCTLCYSSVTQFVFDGTVYDFPALTGITYARVTDCFADADGSIWLAGSRGVIGDTTAMFYRILSAPGAAGPGQLIVTGLPAHGGQLIEVYAVHYTGGGADQFVFAYGGTGLYAVSRGTGTVLYSNTTSGALDYYNIDNQFHAMVPGSGSIWLGALAAKEISLADLSVIRTPTLNNWTTQSADGIIYDPINHALITAPSTGTAITWRYLDRIGESGVLLGDVVHDVAVLAGIDPAEIDVTALTQTITGYDVSGGSGKDWIGPLCDLYDVDPRPHGFMLQFLPRGTASDETIASTAFAAPGGAGPLFTATPENGATDLPRQVTLQFADTAIEQQPANAMSPPLFDGGSQRSQSLDMSSLALSAATARQLVARFARRQRFDAKGYSLALPLSRIDLEPGAVKTLDLAGVAATVRLQSMVLDADRRIATEWKADAPSVAGLDGAAGAPADGHSPAGVVVPLLSKGFVLDLPLLHDIDEHSGPVIYDLAAPYATGAWPGATLMRAQSGEYSDEIAAIDSSSAATWGYATTVLAAPGSPWLWDRARSVNVKLQLGSLTGTTEAAIDASMDTNLALLGGELIQFAAATLEVDGSYTLSRLKRARRGTEWAVASHSAGETFVLLNAAAAVPLDLSLVGTNQSFKAVTNGRTEAGAFPIPLTPFSGASKKPYAPCHLVAVKDAGTGDWALSWVRRTRIGGAWTSGTPIPLGEASAAYVVEILNGGAVVRTITGLTSAAATWTASQQTTDFGSGQSSVSWRVYQISDTVGRGFAAAA